MMGLGFTIVLIVLGGIRELLGHGTLLSGAQMMFGPGVDLTIDLVPGDGGFLLALLPPGAFLGLGLLVALKNTIDSRIEARSAAPSTKAVPIEQPG